MHKLPYGKEKQQLKRTIATRRGATTVMDFDAMYEDLEMEDPPTVCEMLCNIMLLLFTFLGLIIFLFKAEQVLMSDK